jgi:hypothetical protein
MVGGQLCRYQAEAMPAPKSGREVRRVEYEVTGEMGMGTVMMTVGRKGVGRITWAEGVGFGCSRISVRKGGEMEVRLITCGNRGWGLGDCSDDTQGL